MKQPSMQVTHMEVTSPRLLQEERALILADLHQQVSDEYLPCWRALQPTLVLISGDWIEGRYRADGRVQTLTLLSTLAKLCPVYYSLGNHELGARGNCRPLGEISARLANSSSSRQALMGELTACGVRVLHNEYVRHGSMVIGGLTSAAGEMIATDWLKEFSAETGFRLLLCHHPEYYDPYVRRHGLDLTVSGHAHGGQWQLFGRGVFAPGQGLFPRYTNGFYDDKHLLVSRGLGARQALPRFGNPKQTILLRLVPAKNEQGGTRA